MIGETLAHYEITAKLGQGGMGEVYRARDTKLDRDVAIKLLPEAFAHDPERVARFQREARTLASLNHANIAGIFGFEESGSHRFLVMELVEGEDLSERLARGPVPQDEFLDYARQMADGLEEAHERGIVHRDLKPANLKITPDGRLKILDFGLARAFQGQTVDEGTLENSPTITAAMTRPGVILGSAAYMAPEQAKGRTVDRRADLWAFGVILWEMLTGQRLFQGEDISDTLAAVLRDDPDWDAVPDGTPEGVRRLLARCLERDPRKRLRDIGEARVRLEQWTNDPSSLADAPADLPAWTRPLFNPSTSVLTKDYAETDPAEVMARTECPIFILNGAMDAQVSTERDAETLAAAARARGAGPVELVIVPNASHNLKRVSAASDPGFSGDVVDEALNPFVAWCVEQLGAGADKNP